MNIDLGNVDRLPDKYISNYPGSNCLNLKLENNIFKNVSTPLSIHPETSKSKVVTYEQK